jgi:hypothetical protein
MIERKILFGGRNRPPYAKFHAPSCTGSVEGDARQHHCRFARLPEGFSGAGRPAAEIGSPGGTPQAGDLSTSNRGLREPASVTVVEDLARSHYENVQLARILGLKVVREV